MFDAIGWNLLPVVDIERDVAKRGVGAPTGSLTQDILHMTECFYIFKPENVKWAGQEQVVQRITPDHGNEDDTDELILEYYHNCCS